MLTVSTTFFERSPDDHLFVTLAASVKSGVFCGRSECVLLGRDLAAAIERLEILGTTSAGEAELVGGWGDAEHVRLTFKPHGSLGHVSIHVLLREYDPDRDFRVEGWLTAEPNACLTLARGLERSLSAEQCAEVSIHVDPPAV